MVILKGLRAGKPMNISNSVLWRNVALFTDEFVTEFYDALYKVPEIIKCSLFCMHQISLAKILPARNLMIVQFP